MNPFKRVVEKIRPYHKVYNTIYKKVGDYNQTSATGKNGIVLKYAKSVGGPILDAGCGRGNFLKLLSRAGIPCMGIEPSKTCFKKFLKNGNFVSHNCTIEEWARKSHAVYNGVICIDVLEHIPEEELDNNLIALRKLSPNLLAGIANHSDFLANHELHLIQKNYDWWRLRLNKFYRKCNIVIPDNYTLIEYYLMERFFFIQCEGGKIYG